LRKGTIVAAVLMFSVPFLLLASVYDALPAELSVLRNPVSGAAIAPKSAFMVFRVPLMNLTHGLMAAVMLSHANDFQNAERRAAFAAVFTTLLFAIALKSNFEALELSGLARLIGPLAGALTVGTVLSVTGGLGLALARSRRVPLPWPELRMPTLDKVTLAGLFVGYLAIVTASMLISRRV
jgi:hypothetical protein